MASTKHRSLGIERLPNLDTLSLPIECDDVWHDRAALSIPLPVVAARARLTPCPPRHVCHKLLVHVSENWRDREHVISPSIALPSLDDNALRAIAGLSTKAIASLQHRAQRNPSYASPPFVLTIPNQGFDAHLCCYDAALNRLLLRSDLIARHLAAQNAPLLGIETFDAQVLPGTNLVYTSTGFWHVSKHPAARKITLLSTKRRPLVGIEHDDASFARVNHLAHVAESLQAVLAHAAQLTLATALQSVESLTLALHDAEEYDNWEPRIVQGGSRAPAAVVAKHPSITFYDDGSVSLLDDGGLDDLCVAFAWLELWGIVRTPSTTTATDPAQNNPAVSLGAHEKEVRTMLRSLFIESEEALNVRITPRERVAFSIVISSLVENAALSTATPLHEVLDCNMYVATVSDVLRVKLHDLVTDGPKRRRLFAGIRTDVVHALQVVAGVHEITKEWSERGLLMEPDDLPHAEHFSDRAGWLSHCERDLQPGEGVLVGELSTQVRTIVAEVGAKRKYRVSVCAGTLSVKKLGKTEFARRTFHRGGGVGVSTFFKVTLNAECGKYDDMTNEKEVIRELLGMQYGTHAGLWMLSAIFKGDVKIESNSRGCYAKFSAKAEGEGVRVRSTIPAGLCSCMQFGLIGDRTVMVIGGGIQPRYVKIDHEHSLIRVEGEVSDDDAYRIRRGKLKRDFVVS